MKERQFSLALKYIKILHCQRTLSLPINFVLAYLKAYIAFHLLFHLRKNLVGIKDLKQLQKENGIKERK